MSGKSILYPQASQAQSSEQSVLKWKKDIWSELIPLLWGIAKSDIIYREPSTFPRFTFLSVRRA